MNLTMPALLVVLSLTAPLAHAVEVGQCGSRATMRKSSRARRPA
jgi:hypothetical protein